MRRILFRAAAPTLAVFLLAAVPASAETFCVQKIVDCPGTFENTLADALASAAANVDGRDRIELGAYQDTTAATDDAGNPVDIVGLGDSSILRGGGGNANRLTINDPTSTVTGLRVHLTANQSTGIETNGAIRNVTVTAEPGLVPPNTLVGILIDGPSGSVDGASVFLPTAANSDAEGVRVESAPTGVKTINDVRLEAERGVTTLGAGNGDANRVAVRNAFVRASVGIAANGSRVDVENALVEAATTGSVGLDSLASGASSELRAQHVTLAGPAPPTSGSGVLSFDGDGAGPLASTVELTNSVVSGFVKDLRRFGNGILTANWSRFATGDGPSSGADNTSAAPGFVNPGARDFRLAAGSPLIDAGDPAPFGVGGLLTDLDGAPRPLNGEADCSSARRDMGAFEFQPGQRAPIDLTASAAAGSASTGEPVGFSASACDPDGDPLTYSWRFDDGSTASGASVSKSFATGGTHTGTVTASDGANTATKAATVQVVAPTQSLLSFSMLRDSFAVGSAATPITGAAKKPKRGSAFRFKLAIAGDITITVDALLSGRVSKGKCVSPTRALRNAKRCTRVVKKGAFRRTGKAGDNSVSFSGRIGTKALAPGSYRATLAAIGTQSRSVRFKIVRG